MLELLTFSTKKHLATCEQKHVFLSTGLLVNEIPKKIEKIRKLGGKMVIEKWRFYRQEARGEDRKSLMKPLK